MIRLHGSLAPTAPAPKITVQPNDPREEPVQAINGFEPGRLAAENVSAMPAPQRLSQFPSSFLATS